ncbi:MAG: acetyl-CoA carboxylase carboxyl transferase subunit alpha [Acidobacteria bacterium 21-70-11]|nr:MAG: acetyl-CoA carboxylase carboxyl transferase subunit alpha [Acidobacteria bacterium 21-70-11]OYW06360.1 MAG: acetyl-CoA carboxylase carboxyl transferase subunit alpha [Acidobacteria bacterium 37-71-11]HQT93794.1 acetyl-CoA carboxylase carboxyltransferase subunit alpha [Thermoanaerobaculaceae bacterium]HQU33953.1 acetyl-CoA carboxylase carboxyltransferase subunit alpha [Thermoanaerobaculaceae bacterium]
MAGSPTPQFLAPIEDLRQRIQDAERAGGSAGRAELARLRSLLEDEARQMTANLTPWQQCQLARHPDRPYCLDYVRGLFTDWVELRGDRAYGDDPAIIAGFARLDGESVAVVGHQKGRDTRERLYRNFGQPRPEGYRKALRVMHLAEKFGRPIISLVDTQGAYPGIDAEERGQAQAIAFNLREMAALKVPIVVVVTGEGGSGGALAIAIGDTILMLEHAVYSVISPEGCAAILWKDQTQVQRAASALRLTAQNLLELGVIDAIIPEPLGGAHMDPNLAIRTVGGAVRKALVDLRRVKRDELPRRRFTKFRAMGQFVER